MIERLEQLSMSRFIDLACGDSSVLLEDGEKADAETLAEIRNSIVQEYREISDPTGNKSHIAFVEEIIKARIAVTVFSMCRNMLSIGAYDNVREVLDSCGISASSMSDARLAAEVSSRLARANRDLDALAAPKDADGIPAHELRNSFDAQTASLMSHFKFQIDVSSMKATLYAHLVSLFDRELKAQLAALKN